MDFSNKLIHDLSSKIQEIYFYKEDIIFPNADIFQDAHQVRLSFVDNHNRNKVFFIKLSYYFSYYFSFSYQETLVIQVNFLMNMLNFWEYFNFVQDSIIFFIIFKIIYLILILKFVVHTYLHVKDSFEQKRIFYNLDIKSLPHYYYLIHAPYEYFLYNIQYFFL